jgi:hypothetical protein
MLVKSAGDMVAVVCPVCYGDRVTEPGCYKCNGGVVEAELARPVEIDEETGND